MKFLFRDTGHISSGSVKSPSSSSVCSSFFYMIHRPRRNLPSIILIKPKFTSVTKKAKRSSDRWLATGGGNELSNRRQPDARAIPWPLVGRAGPQALSTPPTAERRPLGFSLKLLGSFKFLCENKQDEKRQETQQGYQHNKYIERTALSRASVGHGRSRGWEDFGHVFRATSAPVVVSTSLSRRRARRKSQQHAHGAPPVRDASRLALPRNIGDWRHPGLT